MSISAKTLSLHNGYRAQHGVADLQWCTQLERAAKEHASYLASRNLPVASKPDIAWGQNLFELTNEGGVGDDATSVEKAVGSWYESGQSYTLGEDSNPVGTRGLSFSQLVWKGTQRVGLGVAISSDKKRAVVIAFYDPRGNCGGEFAANVQKYTTSEQKGCPNKSNLVHNLNLQDSTNTNTNSTTTETSTDGTQSDNSREIIHTIHFSSTTSTTSTTQKHDQSSTNDTVTQNSIGTGQTTTQNKESGTTNTSSTSNSGLGGQAASPAQATALELHNQLRAKHGVGAMTLDQKLCESAVIQATNLLAGNKAQGHLGLMDVGQNVYQVTGNGPFKDRDASAVAVTSAVEQWYGHHKEYNWQSPLLSGKYAGSFSQLVWKSSVRLGVGVATRGELTIVVCLYSEPGNISNDKSHRENVLKAN